MSDTKVDKMVMDLLNKVEEKKTQIGQAERPSWKTNCSFGYDPNSNERINIQTVSSLSELAKMLGFLYYQEESFNFGVAELNLYDKIPVFQHQGFTYKEWASDIETRVNQLRIKAKWGELNKLEARVNALVSPEQRRALELEKLSKEID